MKKKLNIIVLLTLVVLTLFTFGCKKEAELGELEDTAKWNNMQSLGGGSQNKLVIRADDYDIDWWVLTDMKGIVFEDFSGAESGGRISVNSEVTLTFDVEQNTNLLLWIAQSSRVPKAKDSNGLALNAGSRDFKGKIIVSPSQGYKVSDSGYREEVSPVGVVKLICDETKNGGSKSGNGVNCVPGHWNGNYRITEIWPLSQENAEWKATEGLKFILEGDDVVEETESVKVIYPAGESVFALKQPDRFSENDMTQGSSNYDDYTNQKDWYWCVKFQEGNIEDGEFGLIIAHSEKEVKSSDCKYHFDTESKALTKSALGTTYIINDSDIVDGSSEK